MGKTLIWRQISQSRTHNNVVFYDNSSGTPIIDEKQTNEFDFTENTQALYFSANKNWVKNGKQCRAESREYTDERIFKES
jgi:hypothetical protein